MKMEFLVKLIEVKDTKDQDARENLMANCTHVAKDFWLFEGDESSLHYGIDFAIIKEEAIEGYGDLSGSEIKRIVCEIYDIDRCYIY
jgi:hypothetical protein